MSSLILSPEGDLLSPSRRRILRAASAAIAGVALPQIGKTQDFWDLPRELWLYRPDTGETIREVYWADGQLIESGYFRICQLLRDTHMNLAVQMDIVTLDIVRGVQGWINGFGIDRPIIINSGYRHPKTNANEGGVRNSLHTMGQAVDLRIDGVSASSVTAFGKYLAVGGVGFYPNKHFTHLDRGRIRYWRG